MKSLLKSLLVWCALGGITTPAFAIYRTWTGAINGYWSNPGNWNPGQPPQTGDQLEFPDVSRQTMTNDMSNVSVATILFENANSVYELDGNTITIAGQPPCQGCSLGVFAGPNEASGTAIINCPLNIAATAIIEADCSVGDFTEDTTYFYVNGPISFGGNPLTFEATRRDLSTHAGGHGELYIAGKISGTGQVTAQTDGDSAVVEFRGTQDNALGGILSIATRGDSHIYFNQSSGYAVTNVLVVEGGFSARLQFKQPDQIGHNTKIVVGDQALLQLSGSDVGAGNVTLEGFSGETSAPTLDTGSVVLGLYYGGITGLCGDYNFSPVVKGKIKLITGVPITTTGSGAGLDIQAAIQGPGGFEKTGDGTLILSASNTFSGDVDVDQGAIDVRNPGALGDNSGWTLLSGTGSITLRNLAINGETLLPLGTGTPAAGVGGSLLFCIGTCAWNGPIALNTNLIVWASDTSLNGPISGTSGVDFIGDTATMGGSSANTYTGTTIAQCNLLQLSKPSGVNAFAGPLSVGGGIAGPYEVRWLQSFQNGGASLTLYSNAIVNLNNYNENFGAVTFNGGEVDTGSGQFAIYQPLTVNPNDATATINGYLGLPAGGARYFQVNDGAADPDLLVNAVVIGNPTYFVKQNAGTMRLNGANTFFATTLHQGGVLDIGSTTGLGNGGGCVISDGATLRLSTSGSVANNFEATGVGTGGVNGAFQVSGNNAVSLSGSIQLDAETLFNVPALSSLSVSGVINGPGALTKNGGGTLTLNGSSANTYSGITTVYAGQVELAKNGAISVPGNLVLGPAPGNAAAVALFLTPNSIGGNTVTINGNSSMNLNGRVQTLSYLNLNDGGSVATGTGTLNLTGGAAVSVGSQSLLGGSVGSSITGNIGIPPNDFGISFSVAPYGPKGLSGAPELDVPANLSLTAYEDPSFSPTRITKSGSGRMRLGGSDNFKTLILSGGTLEVNGSLAGGVTVNSGTLDGTGSVGPVAMTSSSAIVSPGHSPGILTSSNFNNSGGSGVFKVQLNGTNAGTGYSQLVVNGTVNLTGLALDASLGYAPGTNDQFTIIANDGIDGISGAFNGLPQGAQFHIGGQLFQIAYGTGGLFGRNGNDVVLTRLVTPPPPLLTIEREAPDAVQLLWPSNTSAAYVLQFNTNLGPSNWLAISQTPVVVGSNYVVTDETAGGVQRFYRLASP